MRKLHNSVTTDTLMLKRHATLLLQRLKVNASEILTPAAITGDIMQVIMMLLQIAKYYVMLYILLVSYLT